MESLDVNNADSKHLATAYNGQGLITLIVHSVDQEQISHNTTRSGIFHYHVQYQLAKTNRS